MGWVEPCCREGGQRGPCNVAYGQYVVTRVVKDEDGCCGDCLSSTPAKGSKERKFWRNGSDERIVVWQRLTRDTKVEGVVGVSDLGMWTGATWIMM